jgi:hypothetical protein
VTRLFHCVGRWRGTHCDTCGRPVTALQTAEATTGNRLVHLPGDCAKEGQR